MSSSRRWAAPESRPEVPHARRSEAGANPPDGHVVASEAAVVAVGAEGTASLPVPAAGAAVAKDDPLAGGARNAPVSGAAVLARSSAGSTPFGARPADALVAAEVAVQAVAAGLTSVTAGSARLDARAAHASPSDAALVARAAALAQMAARRTAPARRALAEAIAERGVALTGRGAHAARPRGAAHAGIGCVDRRRGVELDRRVAVRGVEGDGGRVESSRIGALDDRRPGQRAAHHQQTSKQDREAHGGEDIARSTGLPRAGHRMGDSRRVFVRAMLAFVFSFLEVFISNLFDALLDGVLKVAPKWAFWPILLGVTAGIVALVYWFFG